MKKLFKIIYVILLTLFLMCSYKKGNNPISSSIESYNDTIPDWITDTTFLNCTLYVDLNNHLINTNLK